MGGHWPEYSKILNSSHLNIAFQLYCICEIEIFVYMAMLASIHIQMV